MNQSKESSPLPAEYIHITITNAHGIDKTYAIPDSFTEPSISFAETMAWLKNQPDLIDLDPHEPTPEGHITVAITSEDPDQYHRFSFPADKATPVDLVAARVRLRQLSHPQLTEMLDLIKRDTSSPVNRVNPKALAVYGPPTIHIDTSPLDKLEAQFNHVWNMFLTIFQQTLDDMVDSGRIKKPTDLKKMDKIITKSETCAFEYWKAQVKLHHTLLCPNYDESEVVEAEYRDLTR